MQSLEEELATLADPNRRALIAKRNLNAEKRKAQRARKRKPPSPQRKSLARSPRSKKGGIPAAAAVIAAYHQARSIILVSSHHINA